MSSADWMPLASLPDWELTDWSLSEYVRLLLMKIVVMLILSASYVSKLYLWQHLTVESVDKSMCCLSAGVHESK